MKDINLNKYYKTAIFLAWITIIYNIIEGLVSIYFGFGDEQLSLFGFGLDSFVETVSAIGVLYMLYRQKRNLNDSDKRSSFEKNALKITAYSFFVLTGILIVLAVNNILVSAKPNTGFWGLIVSGLSIISMSILIKAKMSIGHKLQSKALIADAKCNVVCVYMSITLLISSGLFELFKFGYFDVIGALALAYFSYKEGIESLDKSKDKKCSCEC